MKIVTNMNGEKRANNKLEAKMTGRCCKNIWNESWS
jgi:hypothetical protein